ncbi:MAG TPA: hypothetical protein VG167_06515, partial [Verrucomicrobiae bacterium]|nr:hypothetical protein [Verrucomicrobiae bacterium]
MISTIEKEMNSIDTPAAASPQHVIEREVNSLMAWLPDRTQLSSEERRGIIARYAAVLEGNFIYWMTGTYLAARSPE